MRVRPSASSQRVPARDLRPSIEQELGRFLERQQLELSSFAPEALPLLDEIRAVLGAGGKRLRPMFCYWGYRAGGGREERAIVRAAGAVELLHTAALVHDDVMDHSPLRRGEPTTFRRLAASGGAGGGSGSDFGRSAAILAGDLAQALADRALVQSGFVPERLVAAFAPFNRMRLEAVGGQYLDLLSPGRHPGDETGARRVASLKSGSYTVVGPLAMGAALAGASGDVQEALARYGRPLGEAFQLRDDVLGTFGDPAVTGKDRDTDIREGKRTTLVAKAWQLGGPEVRELLSERLGRPDAGLDDVEAVRSAIRDSGALAETIALVDSLAAEAKGALGAARIEPDASEALALLADLVALRDD